MTMVRWGVAVLALATLSSASASPASRGSSSTDPVSTLGSLASAFETRSSEKLAALLTSDFHHHEWGMALRHPIEGWGAFVTGYDRDAQLQDAEWMFGDDDRALDSIALVMDDPVLGSDPEHPDSTSHYRTISIARFSFTAKARSTGRFWINPMLNIFHLVRGDAALIPSGQTRDSSRWYLRRWVDMTTAMLAVNTSPVGCGRKSTSTDSTLWFPMTPAPTALAIQPIDEPACPALDLSLLLPGADAAQIDVFDVVGRQVTRRPISTKSAGAVTIQAGAGVSIPPGIYWLRLTQGQRRAATRMVVVTD